MKTGMSKVSNENTEKIPKKRGRKPKLLASQNNTVESIFPNHIIEINKSSVLNQNTNNNTNNDINNIVFTIEENNLNNNSLVDESQGSVKPVAKKRGRKPKGGKIIQQTKPLISNIESKPNVILHLKCSMKDLQNNSSGDNLECFGFESSKNDFSYEIIGDESLLSNSGPKLYENNYNNNIIVPSNASSQFISNFNEKYESDYLNDDDNENDSEPREITKKLKNLERNLHTNNVCDKKSACFWCTHSFDNPPIHIPKCYIKDSYQVYGCSCSPECATAYLLEENIESSIKFERYQLLNNIYCKIYDYKQNIKPAPNPYYMLDKYYGNLTIQEYRSLLKNERLFLIVDKPLTRILPELHEYNEDFILNNKIIPSNASFRVKKKIGKQNQTKHNILNERFANIQQ
jgi:hypothetical protein